MGRYEYGVRRRTAEKQKEPHPIWRGIGCLMIILLPIISYALADATIQAGIDARWSFLPYELLGRPQFPDIVWDYWQISRLVYPITKIDNLYANLALAFFYLVIFGGLASLGYAIIYRYLGPSRYGPQDVPPPKIKTKPYKR
jgi:hypothetical protein